MARSSALVLVGAFALMTTACSSAEPENCWPGIEKGRSYRIRIIERHAEGSAWFGLIGETGPASCGPAMDYASGLEITFTVAGKSADPDHGGCMAASGPVEGVTDVTFLDSPPTGGGGGIDLFYTNRRATHGACEGFWQFYIHGNQASKPDPFPEPVPGVPPAIYLARRFTPDGLSSDCAMLPGACADFYIVDLDPL